MYGCDGDQILIWSPQATMKVPKKDAVRLAKTCLAQQHKFTLVDAKRYLKHLRELEQLRRFVEPRRR